MPLSFGTKLQSEDDIDDVCRKSYIVTLFFSFLDNKDVDYSYNGFPYLLGTSVDLSHFEVLRFRNSYIHTDTFQITGNNIHVYVCLYPWENMKKYMS